MQMFWREDSVEWSGRLHSPRSQKMQNNRLTAARHEIAVC